MTGGGIGDRRGYSVDLSSVTGYIAGFSGVRDVGGTFDCVKAMNHRFAMAW